MLPYWHFKGLGLTAAFIDNEGFKPINIEAVRLPVLEPVVIALLADMVEPLYLSVSG